MRKPKVVPENDFAIQQLMSTKMSDRFYKKLDEYQLNYYKAIADYDVIFVDEKAGTGKTTIAVMAGLEYLRQGKVNSLLYLRFPDVMAGGLGFLPGLIEDKESIYMGAFYNACAECGLQPEAVDKLHDKGLINMSTNIGLRGVNLKNTFVIVDETQNGNIKQIQLVLTRIHDDGGKAIIIGHSGQMDNTLPSYGIDQLNPFQVYQLHMLKKVWATKCELPINYRGKISKWSDEIQQTIKELEG